MNRLNCRSEQVPESMWVSPDPTSVTNERAESLAHAPPFSLRDPYKRRTHVLGPADGGGVDEATLQVTVPEEAIVRLHARESGVVNNLRSK